MVGEVKNTTTVFPAFRKRRIKGTERGDWESPPLYFLSCEVSRADSAGALVLVERNSVSVGFVLDAGYPL